LCGFFDWFLFVMSVVKVNLKLRVSDLNSALQRVEELSNRTAAYLANKACLSIAINAHRMMPVVPPAQIKSEMEASVMVSRRNSSLLTRRTRAQSIILASFYPNSQFNIRTGHVFQRTKPTFTGDRNTRRLKFWEWVSARAEHMTKARRSSSGFYKLGCAVVRLIFSKNRPPVANAPADIGEGVMEAAPQAGDGKVGRAIGRVAGGTLATDGQRARASFWVTTTEPDSKGVGTGITKVLEPIWQRAVDQEATQKADYAEQLYAQVLRDAGFTVK
jgi:hypothetical protein